jgi:hypothetical protein
VWKREPGPDNRARQDGQSEQPAVEDDRLRSPHRGGARHVHSRGTDARERFERRGAPARLRRDSAQRGRPDECIPAPRARTRRPGPPARQVRAEARRAPTRVPIFNAVAPSRSRLPSNELTHAVRQGSGTPVAPGRPSLTTLRDRRERDLRRVISGAGGVTARPSRATAPCSPARGLPATAVLRQRYTSGRRSSRVPREGQRMRFALAIVRGHLVRQTPASPP